MRDTIAGEVLMSITSMADRRITVRRRTPLLVDPAPAAASMSPDRQPVRGSIVEVEVSGGTDNTGTVTINGTVGGSPDTEVLTFSGPGALAGVKYFEALDDPALTTTGLAGESTVPTVQARAVGSDGSRHHQQVEIVSGWPARFDRSRASWPHPTAGSTGVEKTRFYVDYNSVWEPRRGDVIIDERTEDEWMVYGAPTLHSQSIMPHHWEIEVREMDGASEV